MEPQDYVSPFLMWYYECDDSSCDISFILITAYHKVVWVYYLHLFTPDVGYTKEG